MPLSQLTSSKPFVLIAGIALLAGGYAAGSATLQTQSGSTTPDGKPVTATAAGAESSGDRAKSEDAKAGVAAGQAASDDQPPAETSADAFKKRTKAVEELISGSMTWVIATLLILAGGRKQIVRLLDQLILAIQDRGVTFDVGSVVKVQVADRATGVDEPTPSYSPSPFDIDDDAPPDRSPLLEQIVPQLKFAVSDSVGEFWEARDTAPATRMRQERTNLSTRLEGQGATFAGVKTQLITYFRALEGARFLEARHFVPLLDAHRFLQEGISALKPKNITAELDDFVILHCTGVALTQAKKCGRALEVLKPATWNQDTPDAPLYLPAGSIWLAAAYHGELEKLEKPNAGATRDTTELLTIVTELIRNGTTLWQAIDGDDFQKFQSQSLKGYYVREVRKDLGTVASVAAEHLSTLQQRRDFLRIAEPHLEQVANDILGEVASPLDHNNLADLYRQLGDLARKLDQDEQAARTFYDRAGSQLRMLPSVPPDPTYANTRALLFYSERRFDQALRALAEYPSDLALHAKDTQDLELYFGNEILAAKVAVAQHGDARGVAHAIALLEDAAEVITRATRLDRKTAGSLEAQIRELLAFAYLSCPAGERSAVTAFDRLWELQDDWKPTLSADFRARAARASALGRIARQHRRQSAHLAAAETRERAAVAVNLLFGLLPSLKIDATVIVEHRQRHVGVWLDALLAGQLLAEEQVAGSEAQRAQRLSEAQGKLLDTLQEAIVDLSATVDVANVREGAGRIVARRALLGARVLLQTDPSLAKDGTITTVRDRLADAYGVDAQHNCQADLELGALLITSARLKKGDPQKDYTEAVAALERAVERDVPQLRGAALRALAQAYALRPVIMRPPRAAPAPAKDQT